MNIKTELTKRLNTTVGVELLGIDGKPRCQVTGPLGTDPRYPNKWLVSTVINYVIFEDSEVRDIKNDKITIRLK